MNGHFTICPVAFSLCVHHIYTLSEGRLVSHSNKFLFSHVESFGLKGQFKAEFPQILFSRIS